MRTALSVNAALDELATLVGQNISWGGIERTATGDAITQSRYRPSS
jgi:hypothetical protein